jgi:hypothetical protein
MLISAGRLGTGGDTLGKQRESWQLGWDLLAKEQTQIYA